jgi:uncharacterized protein (DUF58 family)
MLSPSSLFARYLRWRRRWYRSSRGRITRAGWWYLAITVFLGFAGINTGNNLLFLIFGLLLSGLLLSGVLRVMTQSGIVVERELPEDATVGKPILVGFKVTNHKQRWSSYALVIRDVTVQGPAGQSFVLTLRPGETKALSYRWEPKTRGQIRFEHVEFVTRFPFGLLEGIRDYDAPGDVVVFPREVIAGPIAHRHDVGMGERPSGAPGIGSEFFGLRDQRLGDDSRSIHWLTTARRGRPVVIDHERERRRRVTVILDNRLEILKAEAGGTNSDELLDRLVETAAAVVRRAEREGCEVACAAAGESVPPGNGQLHVRRVLRMLALLKPTKVPEPPVPAPGSDRIVVGPHSLPPTREVAA